MLEDLKNWLVDLFRVVVGAVYDVIVDALTKVLDLVLGAIVGLISLIPMPAALSGGLQSVWSTLDSGIVFFASAAGLPQALAIIGSAYMFRLLRKVVTLFQW